MSCPDELELFLLREGDKEELTPERAKEIADHLTSCPECQGKLAELQALGQALSQPEPLSDHEKASMMAAVVRRIDEQEKQSPAPGLSKIWVIGVPLAAAICCGLVALVVLPMSLMLDSEDRAETVATNAAQQTAPASESVHRGVPGGPSDLDYQVQRGVGSLSEESDEEGGGVAAATPPSTSSSVRRPTSKARRRASGGSMPERAQPGGMESSAADTLSESAPAPRMRQEARQPPSPDDGSLMAKQMGGQPSIAPQKTIQARPAAAPPSAIDPNGRFATTYRPGRGHMARFERTMLQGQNVPEPVIALVADEGRGAGIQLAAPTGRALDINVAAGMTRLSPQGGPVHLALTLRSTAQQPTSRPKVAVHLVMDTSGSMSGTPIDQARQAALQLVSLLQDSDRFSLISYSSNARVVVSDGPVGPRRAQILRQIMALQASGGTNLEAGLTSGYEQARQSRSQEDSVQLAIVLSDGRPNQGITNPWVLSEMSAAAFQAGIETTTIGVGDSYEPQVMSAIAEYGAGGYYYLPDASTIEQVLQAELNVRCQPVARAVELRVRLGQGVELLEAYGSRRLNEMEAARVRQTEVAIDHQEAHRSGINRDRQEDIEGGMRFFIPGFARDDQHTILLRLRVPAGTSGSPLSLANIELRYKDRVRGTNEGDERQVQVVYGSSATEAFASQDRNVRRAVFSFRTGQALSEVSRLLNRNANDEALALLYERVEVLRRAGEQLDDGALRADADRLDSFRQALLNQTMGNALMMGSLLHRAGNGFMR